MIMMNREGLLRRGRAAANLYPAATNPSGYAPAFGYNAMPFMEYPNPLLMGQSQILIRSAAPGTLVGNGYAVATVPNRLAPNLFPSYSPDLGYGVGNGSAPNVVIPANNVAAGGCRGTTPIPASSPSVITQAGVAK